MLAWACFMHRPAFSSPGQPTSYVRHALDDTSAGYIAGIHAPGRRGDIATAGRVLLHKLRAHSAAYAAIKSQEGGGDVRVGLVHQQITFEPEGEY